MSGAPSRQVDVAVVGLGTMGSMALWHLTRTAREEGREPSVLGIEQFGLGHTHGSFSGESRLFRVATKEGDMFPSLARRARELWLRLGADYGSPVLLPTGVLHIAPADHADLAVTRAVIAQHGLPHRDLDAAELRQAFPPFRVREEDTGLLDLLGGALRPERAVLAAATLAREGGAEVWTNTPTLAITPVAEGVEVTTARGTVLARRAVVTAGAWTTALLPELADLVQIAQYTLSWFAPRDIGPYLPERFPGFMRDLGEVHAFGAPSLDGYSLKVAPHLDLPPLATIEEPVAQLDREQLRWLGEQAREILPDLAPEPVRWSVHPDSWTPSRRPLIDTVAEGRIAIATGMSGNGFKFAPVYGELLARMVGSGDMSGQHPQFTLTWHEAQRLVAPV